jgi:hypothetical protein
MYVFGRQRRCCVAKEAAVAIQPRRQPSLAQAIAEFGVDTKRGLM